MLKYSELSKAQKVVINEMKRGCVLRLTPDGYTQSDGKNTFKVKASMANSLYLRHFILECFHDYEKDITEYCLNADISYGNYPLTAPIQTSIYDIRRCVNAS